ESSERRDRVHRDEHASDTNGPDDFRPDCGWNDKHAAPASSPRRRAGPSPGRYVIKKSTGPRTGRLPSDSSNIRLSNEQWELVFSLTCALGAHLGSENGVLCNLHAFC